MNRITKMLAGITAGVALSVTAMPAQSRVDPKTTELIQLLDREGINVVIDDPTQCDGEFHGSYQFAGMKRSMILCPGTSVDADDHNTVRHETVHAIQHCVNMARQTPLTDPIMDLERLKDMVNTHLSSKKVDAIKATYPVEHWLVEFEAFLVSDITSAQELMDMFTKACVA